MYTSKYFHIQSLIVHIYYLYVFLNMKALWNLFNSHGGLCAERSSGWLEIRSRLNTNKQLSQIRHKFQFTSIFSNPKDFSSPTCIIIRLILNENQGTHNSQMSNPSCFTLTNGWANSLTKNQLRQLRCELWNSLLCANFNISINFNIL